MRKFRHIELCPGKWRGCLCDTSKVSAYYTLLNMLYECVYVQRRFIVPEAEVDSLNVCVVESFGQFDVSRIK